MASSILGFTVSADRSVIGVRPFTVPGTDVSLPGGLRAEVAPLLLGFAAEFHATVEPLVPGWCWGYAYRTVRGGALPSFHSAGIAIDLNAPRHPLGRRGTFTSQQAARIRTLAAKYGLRWGGDYRSRADEMHCEIIKPRPEALALVARLQPPAPVKEDDVLKRGDTGSQVEQLQGLLNDFFAATGPIRPDWRPLRVDGDYGTLTAEAVTHAVGRLERSEFGLYGWPVHARGAPLGDLVTPATTALLAAALVKLASR